MNRPLHRKLLLLAVAGTLAGGARLERGAAQDIDLVPGMTARLATREEAAEILAASDDHALAMSRYDRSARMRVAREVSRDEFLAFAREQALGWEAAEGARFRRVLEAMGKKLAALDAGLTGRVILVKTTGLEEAGAAYTRGAAIILKQSALQADDDALERLLLHELFHVVSRSAPGLRRELYAVIGFAPANEIDLPASLAGRKITNPDAPRIDCRIEVLADGRRVSATPVLYSREAAYDPATSGGLLAAMEFKLLVLEETGGQWVAASREGKPWLLDPEKTPSFHEKIGANTGYVIHPEEILAENFVLLATGTRNLRTPRVVEGLHRVLRSRRRL